MRIGAAWATPGTASARATSAAQRDRNFDMPIPFYSNSLCTISRAGLPREAGASSLLQTFFFQRNM
jgi:hypothetical protein